MKRVLLALGVLTMLFSTWCFAQSTDPSNDSKPASSNVPGAEYPRIHSDLRVTFRLKAPDAQKVRLHLDKDYDLVRDSDGVWSVTTTPQVPGFHYYWFTLDGVNVCDPASETFYDVSRQYSGIEVPEKGVDFYHPKDVARVELLGAGGPLTFTRDASGLVVNLPEKKPNEYAYALKITPK